MGRDIQEVIRYLTGKRVAIVGNAQSIFGQNNDIDSYDVVIRFNKGFILKPESQGTRTDILMLACDLDDDKVDSYHSKIVISRATKYKNKHDYILDSVDKEVLRNKIYINQPTTGFIAIDMCMTANAKITLYGFDFERTPTFYNPQGYKTPHHYKREEEIVRLYEKSGILTIKE